MTALDAAYLDLAAECDHVFVAGLSMGGALALRIAATRPVAGAVVVNPGLVIDDPRAPAGRHPEVRPQEHPGDRQRHPQAGHG